MGKEMEGKSFKEVVEWMLTWMGKHNLHAAQKALQKVRGRDAPRLLCCLPRVWRLCPKGE